MNRWSRVNLWLAALATALLALYLWPATTTGPAPLTPLAAADIASIRIERGDRLELTLQRSHDGWELQYPHQGPARTQRVGPLLSIATAAVQQDFAADKELGQYGLQPPAAVLHLDGLRLAFGGRDPSQRSRYVLVGDRIRVVDDLYFNLLTLPAAHFAGD